MVNARLRRRPWVMWLQDILPDGAVSTGLLGPGRALDAARRLERTAYRSAERIVVISDAFADNLRTKGVAGEKIVRLYNPSTRRAPAESDRKLATDGVPRVLSMGNIGLSQGLPEYVRQFEASTELESGEARLLIAGHGVAAEEVRAPVLPLVATAAAHHPK